MQLHEFMKSISVLYFILKHNLHHILAFISLDIGFWNVSRRIKRLIQRSFFKFSKYSMLKRNHLNEFVMYLNGSRVD